MKKVNRMDDALTKIGLYLLLFGFALAMIGLLVMIVGYAMSEIF